MTKHSKGWVKLNRSLLSDPVMQDDALARLLIYCYLKASFKAHLFLLRRIRKAVPLEPGQFVTGRKILHRELYADSLSTGDSVPDPSTVWRRLKALEKLGHIQIASAQHYSVVTVHEMAAYDGASTSGAQPLHNPSAGDTQPSHESRSIDAQRTHTEEEGKRMRRKESPPTPKGGAERVDSSLQEFLDAFNAVPGFAGCPASDRAIERAWKKRLKSATWADDWRNALGRARSIPFFLGQSKTGWRMTVTWFLRGGNVEKILRGEFDRGTTAKPTETKEQRDARIKAEREKRALEEPKSTINFSEYRKAAKK